MKFSFITIFIGIFICDSKVSSNLIQDIVSEYSTQGAESKADGHNNLNKSINKTNQIFFESTNTSDTDSVSKCDSILNPKTTINQENLLGSDNNSTVSLCPQIIEEFHRLPVNNVSRRSYDSSEDNEQLLMKITDDNGGLPPNFQLKSDDKGDPILVYNGPKIINPELKNIKKREVKSSEQYDYNYYDDIGQDVTSKMKEESHEDSLDKSYKHPGLGKAAVYAEGGIVNSKQTELDNKTHDLQSDITEPTKALKKDNETKEVTYIETREVVKHLDTEESPNIILPDTDDTDLYSYNSNLYHNGSKQSEVSNVQTEKDTFSGIISKPKGKETCCYQRNEPARCLPSGGPPKNPRIVVFTKTNDSEYSQLIKGDLIEILVKRVMDRVAGNTKLLKELGLCSVDLTDVRDLYRKARNNSNCCLKVEEEFSCFLTWMLTDDLPTRKKRSSRDDFEEISREPEELSGAPSCVNINTLSPQYQRLFEKVEEYKESDDSWDTIIYSEAPA